MTATGTTAKLRRLGGLTAVACFAYPAALVASFYATWFSAWMALGRPPRPSLDDLKSIGLVVDVPYAVTLALIAAMPVALVLGAGSVVLLFGKRQPTRSKQVLATLAGWLVLGLLWLGAIGFLRADPWQVASWYFD